MVSTPSSSPTGTQSISRAIAVLRSVAALPRGKASLTAVVRMTGLTRTTAFRLLQGLVEERMLAFDADGRSYHIGRLAIELGLSGGDFNSIALPWREQIHRLSQQTNLTAHLVARSGSDVVCLEYFQAETVLRAVPLLTGQRLPLGIGAGSLAILASLPDADIDAVLSANRAQMNTLPSRRITDVEMWRRVEETRRHGYSYSAQTVAKGAVGIGMVLPSDGGVIELAVSLSKVGDKLDAREQAELVTIMRKVLLAEGVAKARITA